MFASEVYQKDLQQQVCLYQQVCSYGSAVVVALV